MVNLSPPTVVELENSRRSDVQVFDRVAVMIGAALPPDRPEHIADAMAGVIPDLDMNIRWALEDHIVHLMRNVRASADAPERVIDGDFVGRGENSRRSFLGRGN
jgi:hypothetical protein